MASRNRSSVGAAALWVGLSLGPVTCGSTGSEGGAPGPEQTHCPCGWYIDWAALDATVTAVSDGRLELQVDAVLNDGTGIEAGAAVGGSFSGTYACDESPLTVELGQRVFAFFKAGSFEVCPEWRACVDACGEMPSDPQQREEWDLCASECDATTESACAAQQLDPLLQGELAVAPWGETLDFGEGPQGQRVLLMTGPDFATRAATIFEPTYGDISGTCMDAMPEGHYPMGSDVFGCGYAAQ